MNTDQLLTRAMLVSLNISSWSARKYDRKVSQEVADAHGADMSAGRYNKHLLPTTADITNQKLKAAGKKTQAASTPNSYKDLMQHITEVRAWHYANTLPWTDDGRRVLTVANYTAYTDYIRDAHYKFDRLLAMFATDYPALRAEAQRILNGMFNREDYPDSVRDRFDFKIKIDPIPENGDWRVKLPESEIKVLAAQLEERTRATFEDAQADVVKRLHKVVSNMVERLSTETKCVACKGKGTKKENRKRYKANKGKKVTCWICDGRGTTRVEFHETLLTNARELTDLIKRINLADDPKLEEYRRQIDEIANSTDIQTLREDHDVRKNAAEKAQSILDQMNATYKGMFA